MKYKKFFGAALAALMIVIAITLVSAPGAWAQSKYKTLHKFAGGTDGNAPYSDVLVFDSAGSLYGTTEEGGNLNTCTGSGCGTVFKLTPNQSGGWTESVLHRFKGGKDGDSPSGLTFDAAGSLYGTTGGANGEPCNDNCGTIFKLTLNSDGSWTESVLY